MEELQGQCEPKEHGKQDCVTLRSKNETHLLNSEQFTSYNPGSPTTDQHVHQLVRQVIWRSTPQLKILTERVLPSFKEKLFFILSTGFLGVVKNRRFLKIKGLPHYQIRHTSKEKLFLIFNHV